MSLMREQVSYPFQGRRVDLKTGDYLVLKLGEYGRYRSTWFGRTPNGLACDLTHHNVIEHEDGTLTCSPSIDVKAGDLGRWHGFLERGVWKLA